MAAGFNDEWRAVMLVRLDQRVHTKANSERAMRNSGLRPLPVVVESAVEMADGADDQRLKRLKLERQRGEAKAARR